MASTCCCSCFLVSVVEAGELDAHARLRHRTSGQPPRCGLVRASSQKVMFRTFPTGKGQHGLDITATAVYVCRLRVHVRPHALLIADFNGKGNPLSRETFSCLRAVGAIRETASVPADGGCSISFCQGQGCPSSMLTPTSIFCACPGIDHPYHLAAGFFVAKLHSDYVPRLQLCFQARELGAMIADVSGLSILGEWTTVRVHSKDSDREVHVNSGFWFVGHADSSDASCSSKPLSIKS